MKFDFYEKIVVPSEKYHFLAEIFISFSAIMLTLIESDLRDASWYSYIAFLMVFCNIIIEFVYGSKNRPRYGYLLAFAIIPIIFSWGYALFESEQCFVGGAAKSGGDYLYFSYVTFTTLGYGDLQPIGWCRGLASFEALLGLIFIGYVAAQFSKSMQR